MTRPPVLWHFPISHFNEKARWALDWKRIPHVLRALALSYVPRALWATGQAKLPILFLDGKAIAVYNIKTGAVLGPPAPRGVARYAVRVQGSDVEVEV